MGRSTLSCLSSAGWLFLVAVVGATAYQVHAAEPMLGASAQSSVSVDAAGDVVTVRRVNRTFDLSGPDLDGRKADDRLLLRQSVETTEVIGDKGMEGRVELSAWPLGSNPDASPPLYVIAASGRDGRVINGDVYVVERGLDEVEWQSAFSLADGGKLFDATVPWLLATSGGAWKERRYIALAQIFEDADDAALRRDDAIALLTYASRTRVLDQVLIRADTADRARLLRSVWDQTVEFGWHGSAKGTAPPDGSMIDLKSADHEVSIRFSPDGATLQVPIDDRGFIRNKAKVAKGLSLRPFPPNLLLGRWLVTDAKPAPWLTQGADIAATVALFINRTIEVATTRVRSESPIACEHARYDTAVVPPPGLFQGGFEGEAAVERARRFGLSADETRSVSLTCDTGIYEFHLPEPNVALTAFDNVIFTLTRQP